MSAGWLVGWDEAILEDTRRAAKSLVDVYLFSFRKSSRLFGARNRNSKNAEVGYYLRVNRCKNFFY